MVLQDNKFAPEPSFTVNSKFLSMPQDTSINTHCNRHGHIINTYYCKHGFPLNYGKKTWIIMLILLFLMVI